MKKISAIALCLLCAGNSFAGFRVKLIKPKNAEQFQTRVAIDAVTFAADMVVSEKDQNSYFYKALIPSRVFAVRLAIYNRGSQEVTLPLERVQFLDASGHEVAPVAPDAVAQAVLKGLVIKAEPRDQGTIGVAPRLDPRLDPTDPRNDPNDPRYRRYPPVDPNDPRYDPNDPRNGRYPNGTRPYVRSGIDIVMIPGSGGDPGDLSRNEKALVEKDFADKSHRQEPIPVATTRDKFLFFAVPDEFTNGKGFTLRVPQGKGMIQEIVLKF
jgi:hypothetical protein